MCFRWGVGSQQSVVKNDSFTLFWDPSLSQYEFARNLFYTIFLN